jgi:hypothetical protein
MKKLKQELRRRQFRCRAGSLKTRILSVFIAVAIVLTMIPSGAPEVVLTAEAVTPATLPAGSRAISNREELEAISSRLDSTFHLTNDIDLGEEPWTPIGTELNPFTGILDGRGFVISNMNITGEHTNAGLFGVACIEAVIRNLGVEGVIDMFGNRDDIGLAGGTAGGIVGLGRASTGTSNVIPASRRGEPRNARADGAVGPTITASYADVDITLRSTLHTHSVGGIIGRYGNVDNCYSLGNITTRDGRAGGIGGRFTHVSNSFNRGNITNTHGVAGGIVGRGELCGILTGTRARPIWLGVVNGSYNTGNIVGGPNPTPVPDAAPVFTTGGIGGEGVEVANSFWLQTSITGTARANGTRIVSTNRTNNEESNSDEDDNTSKALAVADMRIRERFQEAGWNFGAGTRGVWIFPANTEINDGFPMLRSSRIFAEILCDAIGCGADTWTAGGSPWSVWVMEIEVECEIDGREIRICNNCDALENRFTESPGHEWGNWTVSRAATCAEEGLRSRTCATCRDVEEETVAKTEHNWGDFHITSFPTTTRDGSRERDCRSCGFTEVRRIPATGAVCMDCGENPCECFCPDCDERSCVCPCESCDTYPCECPCRDCESFPCECCPDCGEFPCECPGECEECGKLPCECDCEKCGKYPCECPCDDCGEHPCECCGECKEPECKCCEECSKEPCVCCPFCNKFECECPSGNECDVSPTGRHVWSPWETLEEPTCTEVGHRARECEHCYESFHGIIRATGCMFGDWEVTVEPTYEATGTERRECLMCEEYEEREIPRRQPEFPIARRLGNVTGTSTRPGVRDALAILRFVVGLELLSGDAMQAAMITELARTRGRPGVGDALAILRFVVKLPTEELDAAWDRVHEPRPDPEPEPE